MGTTPTVPSAAPPPEGASTTGRFARPAPFRDARVRAVMRILVPATFLVFFLALLGIFRTTLLPVVLGLFGA